jgi:hypothetical protein
MPLNNITDSSLKINAPLTGKIPVRGEKYIFRGATLFHGGEAMPLRDTCISPATDVCPYVAEYSPGRKGI